MATDTSQESHKLPFTTIEFLRAERAITFRAGRRQFDCNIRSCA